MSKRIVIAGASGNVGTALLRRLAEHDTDYDVIGIARRRPPLDDVYRSVQWHELDLAEPVWRSSCSTSFAEPNA